MDVARKRTRLDPQVRRELILDEAAAIVAEEGVSAVNMERLGREARISKALVYNYFPSRQVLLSDLLVREYRRFQAEAREAAAGVDDLPTLIRVTTRAYLDHVKDRGVLIQRLMNEPAVSAAVRALDTEGRQHTVEFFGSRIAAAFGIEKKSAEAASDLLMGLTAAAGDYLARTGADVKAVEDMVLELILGALTRLGTKP
jgi:AcrR family transcriptional regulator